MVMKEFNENNLQNLPYPIFDRLKSLYTIVHCAIKFESCSYGVLALFIFITHPKDYRSAFVGVGNIATLYSLMDHYHGA